MSAAARTARIKDLLNTPLATALTRIIVLCSPIALSVLAYATVAWIDERISNDSADTKLRVVELERYRAVSEQKDKEEAKDLAEVKQDVKAVLATVNKMAGAMEARSGLRLTGETPTPLVVANP